MGGGKWRAALYFLPKQPFSAGRSKPFRRKEEIPPRLMLYVADGAFLEIAKKYGNDF